MNLSCLRLLSFLVAAFCGPAVVRAQSPDDLLPLGQRIKVESTGEVTRLDRLTGQLVSEAAIKLTNMGDRPILPPFVVAVELEAPQNVAAVRVAGALGGIGVAPWQWPWLNLSTQAGTQLAPGGVINLQLILTRPAGITPTYRLVAYGKYNRDPLAVPRTAALSTVNFPVNLDGTASTDPDGDALTYAWDLGDGATATGATPQHTFTRTGTFSVSLTVTDPHGATNTRSVPVTVTPEGVYALARTRTLAGDGQPLEGVVTEQTGPAGTVLLPSTSDDGYLSLGGLPGPHTWKFSKSGHLSVWRQATLADRQLSYIPTPWLTPLAAETVVLSPLFERLLRANGMQIKVPAGAATSEGVARLTGLGPQALPLPLPVGWSPVAALHLDLGTVALGGAAELTVAPRGTVRADAPRVLARFDDAGLRWVANFIAPAGAPLTFNLSGSGMYAIVIPDAAPTAPPAPVNDIPLGAFTGTVPDLASLTGQASVTPNPALASTDPVAITGAARVTFTAPAVVPSGVFLRADMDEKYTLRGGSEVPGSPYDTSVFAYRPLNGGAPTALVAEFPIRPAEALRSSVLAEAVVKARIVSPGSLSAAIITGDGGSASLSNLRLDAGAGAFARTGVLELREVDLAALDSLFRISATESLTGIRAFDVDVSGLAAGRTLEPVLTGLLPGSDFLLVRVVRTAQHSGLEPALRLHSGADGKSISAEPATGPRLPGISGSGRYLLIKLTAPAGLVDGLARNAAGDPAAGLLARIAGQPWLAITRSGGVFQLVAFAGGGTATLADDRGEESGAATFALADANSVAAVTLTLAPAGLRVTATEPVADATAVPVISSIKVRFNRTVNPASFGPEAIILKDGADAAVTTSLTLNLAGNEATMLPAGPLAHSTAHTITVAVTLRDMAGRSLEGPREFTFTTAGHPSRPGGALTIYEPGATGYTEADRALINAIPGYTPGTDSRQIVVTGGPGVAEGRAAVTLVNLTTGETATTVARTDGSFANWLRADKDDYIQAVIRNSNGTRTTLDATRQLFDDGRVGLYGQGGIFPGEEGGGPVEIDVAPGTVPGRTEFQIEPMSLAQLNELVNNVQPEGGAKIAAGARLRISGDTPQGDAEVSFALDPATLNLGPGETPENGAFALCMVEFIEGDPVFRVVDQMRYANGRLSTISNSGNGHTAARGIAGVQALIGVTFGGAFSPGLGANAYNYLYALFLGQGPHTIGGRVSHFPEGRRLAGEAVDIFGAGYPALGGASVFAFRMGSRPTARDASGRIPGWVFCTSQPNGYYALVVHGSPGESTVAATHPRFLDARVEGPRGVTEQSSYRNIVFTEESELHLGLTLESSHLPVFPAAGQEIMLTLTASRGGEGDNPTIILPKVEALLALQPGVTFIAPSDGVSPDVTITPVDVVESDGRVRARYKVKTAKALRVTLGLKATSPNSITVRRTHVIDFNGTPAFDGTGTPSDTRERRPPQVAGSFPRPGEPLTTGQPLELRFSEPVNRNVLDQVHLITLTEGISTGGETPPPAVAGGPPTASLSVDKLQLRLWYGGIKPGKIYTLSVPSGAVMDLNRTPLDQDPATKDVMEPFTLTFRSAEQTPVIPNNLSGLTMPRGGGVMLGSLLFVGDQAVASANPADDSASGIKVFDVSKPQTPRALPRCEVHLPGPPSAFALLPDYSYRARVPGPEDITDGPREIRRRTLLAVAGGYVGAGFTANGQLDNREKYLWLFEVLDSKDPVLFPDYDPVNRPVRLRDLAASPVHAADSIINKMVWQPPYLAFLEQWTDDLRSTSRISRLNVQAFISGLELNLDERILLGLHPAGLDINGDGDFDDPGEKQPDRPPVDLNGDGDYADPGEVPPIPRSDQGFYGFSGAHSPDTFHEDGSVTHSNRTMPDFDWKGGVMAAILSDGSDLDLTGQPTGPREPAQFRVFSAGANLEGSEGLLVFENDLTGVAVDDPDDPIDRAVARPRRLLLLPDFPVEVPLPPDPAAPAAAAKYRVELRSLALVTLSPDRDGLPALAIIDVSNPRTPVLLHKISIPPSLLAQNSDPQPGVQPDPGHLYSLTLRADGVMELQGTFHTLLLNPRLLLHAPPAQATRMHDAITGVIRDTGTSSQIPIEGSGGVRVIAQLGQAVAVQTPPQLEFRFFPALTDNDYIANYAAAFAAGVSEQELDEKFAASSVVTDLAISRYRKSRTPEINSTLSPNASSKTHYCVVVRAPGGGGRTLQLGLQGLNAAGWPLLDAPAGLAPTRALTESSLTLTGDQPDDDLAPRVRPLPAHRLSDNPVSKYYNIYVSEPIAIITEEVSRVEVQRLEGAPGLRAGKRHLFTGAHYFQAFLDPSEEERADSVLKAYASRIDEAAGEIETGVFAIARSVPTDFVPGANPPPIVPGNIMAIGGSGPVMSNSGELIDQFTDILLPSRRMPVSFTRTVCNHSVILSAFGPSWDFNFNQRLFIYDPAHIGTNAKVLLLLRATLEASVVAEPKDLIFVNGAGRALLFKFKNRTANPEAARGLDNDPLVLKLDGFKTAVAFYECTEQGIFDIFAKFEDGGFGRLTPGGTQYRYDSQGQLQTVIDRFADDPPVPVGPPAPSNRHELFYRHGRLREIHDLSVGVPRFIKIGYYLPERSKQFVRGLDLPPPAANYKASLRKIARIVDPFATDQPTANADCRYYYDSRGYLLKYEGPEARSPGPLGTSFTGRSNDKYLYDDVHHRYHGIVDGGNVTQGLARYEAGYNYVPGTAEEEQQRTAPVVETFVTRAGTTRYTIGAGSSAAANGGAITTIVSPANLTTKITQDPNGNPKQIDLSGPGLVGTPTWNFEFDHANRLKRAEDAKLRSVLEPLYDEDNPFLRGRGNLTEQTFTPGPGAGGVRGNPLTATNARHDPLYNQPVGVHTDFNGFRLTYSLTDDKKIVKEIKYEDSANPPAFPPFFHKFLTYNQYGQLENKLLPNGKLTHREFDGSTGFLTMETDTGPARRRLYDMNTRAGYFGLPAVIDMPDNADYQMSYDNRLLLLQWSRGASGERYAYDEPGNRRRLQRDTGPGQVYEEEVSYDNRNRPWFITKKQIELSQLNGASSREDLTEIWSYYDDDHGRLKKKELPGGINEFYHWNAAGQPLFSIRGSVTKGFIYDESGRLIEERHNDAPLRKFTYDGFNRIKTTFHVTAAAGENSPEGGDVEEIEYTAAGREMKRVLKNSNGVAASVTTTYDAIGRVLTTVTEGDQVFPKEELTHHQQPNGGLVASRTIDALGLPAELIHRETQITDENGFIRSAFGPLTAVQFEPNPNLTVSSQVITENLRPRDGNPGPTKEFTQEFDYNNLDQLTDIYDDLAPRGGSPQAEYIRRPDGLASETFDGLGFATVFNYSKLGELLETHRPNDVAIGTALDPARRVVSQSDLEPKSTRYEYFQDSERVRQITALDGEVTTLGPYDEATELPLSISRAGGAATTAQTFDRRGRLLTQTVSGSGTTYQTEISKYDAAGRVLEAKFGETSGPGAAPNSVNFNYDLGGPLLNVTWEGPEYVVPRSLFYAYHPNGYPLSVKYPSEVILTHSRDVTGRLLSVNITGSGIAGGDGVLWKANRFFYAGPPDDITNGPVHQTNIFDERRRLSAATWKRTSDDSTLAELRYLYDAADRPIARQETHRSGRTDFFSTDPAGRLTNVHTGARPIIADTRSLSIEPNPDPLLGNLDFAEWATWPQDGATDEDKSLRNTFSPGRWERPYHYDAGKLDLLTDSFLSDPHHLSSNEFAANRRSRNSGRAAEELILHGGGPGPRFTTDRRGNITDTPILHRAAGAIEVLPRTAGLLYDGYDRLVKVQTDVASGSDLFRFSYHYRFDGLRSSRQTYLGNTLKEETTFLYDGDLLIEERTRKPAVSADYKLTARYYYADSDVPFAADLADAQGNLRRFIYLTDHAGSVHSVVETETGTVLEHISYDAFGQPRIEARDTAPPVVTLIQSRSNSSFEIAFSETALPPPDLSPGGILAPAGSPLTFAKSLQNRIVVTNTITQAVLPVDVAYIEKTPVLPGFGSILHVSLVSGTFDGTTPYKIEIPADLLRDEWGNPSDALTTGPLTGFAPALGTTVGHVNSPASTGPRTLAVSEIGNHFFFHGQFFDYETGFYYLRARHYDPHAGEFLQRDPVAYVDSPQPYAAFRHNPVAYRDPSGRQSDETKLKNARNGLNQILDGDIMEVGSMLKGWNSKDTIEFLYQNRKTIRDAAASTGEKGITPEFLGAVLIAELMNRGKTIGIKEAFGSENMETSLGVAQMRAKTVAMHLGYITWRERDKKNEQSGTINEMLSRAEFRALSKDKKQEITDILVNPEKSIGIAAQYLAKLKNRENRYPEISSHDLSGAKKAVIYTEYNMGPTTTPLKEVDSSSESDVVARIAASDHLKEILGSE